MIVSYIVRTIITRPTRRCLSSTISRSDRINILGERRTICQGHVKFWRAKPMHSRYKLCVTDLILDTFSCEVFLLWSALHSCGVRDFIFITLLAKRVTCAQLHCFHKMQNVMLILSLKTQRRELLRTACSLSRYSSEKLLTH